MSSSKHIAKALFDALKRGYNPTELANSLADKMLDSSQGALLSHILFYLEEYAKRDREESSLRIESATEVTSTVVEQISKAFGADKESVIGTIDPDLMGGFRVKHGDILYDATLSTRLRKLKEALI